MMNTIYIYIYKKENKQKDDIRPTIHYSKN